MNHETNDALGWKAIDAALKPIYGEQEPLHYGTQQPFVLGGPDPLDGISAYRNDNEPIPHWHFISYGLTELYDKESSDTEISGFGFELTFRLKRDATDNTLEPPSWVFNFLQNFARYVVETGNIFDVGHRMPADLRVALNYPTDIQAVVFTADPQLSEILTPHGRLKFLQVVGVTTDELDLMKQWTSADFLQVMAEDNPLLVTNLDRQSLLSHPAKAASIQERRKQTQGTRKGLFGRFFG
jgi:hypothetical protein